MKRILLLCLTAVFMLASSESWAQDRTVTGKVTSAEDGTTLPGVNVVLKGTTSGAVTDAEGRFSLSVPANGGVLVFTFIGLTSQEVEIGNRSTIDISMALDAKQLSEVVVTALGEKRETKTLSYAVQGVSAEQLVIARPNNVNDGLAGKVAGIQVRGQSGAALGRNSTIRIRGAGSLSDKEPLYIIDGTPVTNSSDFNPDDIETMSVLKGPSATAIYGQRGDAGVILITTKKGVKGRGLGITLNQNVFFDNVYVLPRYQNSYAGGAEADLMEFTWKPGMPEEWKTLDGKYYHDYTDDASWGPRMVGQDYIPWYAWVPGTKYTGKTAKLVGQPNNIRDFYETGVNRTTNLSFSKANDDTNVRLSYTHQDQTGIMPNTSLGKNTVAVNFNTKLSKLVEVGANINFVNTVINGEFDDAYSNATTGSFNQWFHRNLDMNIMNELQGLKSPEGRLVSWNHFNPDYYIGDSDKDGVINGDKFYRGYYWFNHNAYMNLVDYTQNRNRLFGDINLRFNLTDNLHAAVYYRKNNYTTNNEFKRPSILPYSFYTENRPNNEAQYDYYGTSQTFFKEDNLEFLVAYQDRFLDDKLSVDVSGGANLRMEESSSLSMNTSLGLVVPDLYIIGNSKNPNFGYSNVRAEKQVRSVYARGSFGYNETFFLNWSVRNDWSSALPVNNNSYFYPSIGAVVLFSEYTQSALPFLSLGKLRASWAQVGSDLDPYQLSLNYALSANQWNGNILSSTPDNLTDPNIKPSLRSSYEYGFDLKFFENRVGFSATFVNEDNIDEILTVGVSGASGFRNKIINAGKIHRDVIELTLEATPVKMNNFEWNIAVNWSKVNTDIIELTEGVDAIPASTGAATFNVGATFHVVGERWGQLRGKTIQRDANGNPIVNKTSGLYVATAGPVSFGSVLPDYTGGVVNNFRYKNFNLAFNFDFQKGGKFYSLSDQWGTFSGLTERTAGVNDLGNPVRDAVADGGGVHVVGVAADGEAVDMYVDAQSYYHQFYSSGIADPSVFDLSFVKLRELSLGYQIPVNKIGNLGRVFTSASISAVGRNLLLLNVNKKDFDPAEVSGAFGENGQFPSVRSYGFNIRLGF
ncbi:MAG: SusC/RagA family TonB-linked outer membrane protein [Cyclobacteriaceae bacterium]|nr:SusC/RagA family TonB-linked outer membrane protein [Cyclobacteriaceae bacterium]